ncbi:splicing factor 3B subunit 6-like [Phymastichus coffea]|uniref:splicing factor 3B subunit 6-like n=1 Tax=Phymastichus coffea TaxID=108790 RepID=UPI00273B08B3|nr:splicing factor 3B subunit 6-like [Phymastichus coffea]
MATARRRSHARLQLQVNRTLYVRNLPCNITENEIYTIFGKHGSIDSIRLGRTSESIGTAFVVYEDVFHAQNAYDCLKGVRVSGQYLVIFYYRYNASTQRHDVGRLKKKIDKIGKVRLDLER